MLVLHDLAALPQSTDSPESQASERPEHSDAQRRGALVEQIDRLERQLLALGVQQQQLSSELEIARATLAKSDSVRLPSPQRGQYLTPAQKVTLFRQLFRGREDVYPERFERKRDGKSGYSPVCTNKFAEGLCRLPKIKCGECTNRAFRHLDDLAIVGHLKGNHVVGVYPMLPDETCWFLAMDFDEADWKGDVIATRETCVRLGIPAYVERSRSGNGAHVWIFFSEPVPASLARKLGAHILTETMSTRPELSFDSYDRLFPAQDTMPAGGFGNLIALPLQAQPRRLGNSAFVDDKWAPVGDQWTFLQQIDRIEPERLRAIVGQAHRNGTVLGVRAVGEEIEEEEDSPWLRQASAPRGSNVLVGALPSRIVATLAQRLFVSKKGLPPVLVAQIRRLAAFQNPEFYKKQAMRMSTWDTPRVICCAENLEQHIALPRNCAGDLRALAECHKIELHTDDLRVNGQSIDVLFHGELDALQAEALKALEAHEMGVLVAPPGVGKTVIAVALIARRQRSTLVLVNRKHLLEQWQAQLARFLAIDQSQIGRIGGGDKEKHTGRLDVAMVQALTKAGHVDKRVAEYGQLVVDECHHASSVSYERVLSEAHARYVVGLTATPQRRDGHQAIMCMQLGPIRFEVKPQALAASQSFVNKLIVRETAFHVPPDKTGASIVEIYSELVTDNKRNTAILDDVIATLAEGRHPIVLTQRREHVDWFAERLGRHARIVAVLKGGMGKRAERQTRELLAGERANGSTVLVATGPYVGEGFDDAPLDTLFLAMPIAWKGSLAQYVGRLHRNSPGKREVRVFDYVDRAVPQLASMFRKRLRGYRSLGYHEGELPEEFDRLAEQWFEAFDGLDDEFDAD
ncbi:MAG TPA: DEAD/DEAH box helicase family protein [Polyangiaceae bacterium]